MRILYNNYISSAVSINSYSQNSNYPVENISDSRLSRVYRTDNMASTEYIVISGLSIPANYVSIVNHNVSSSCTIYVEASSSSGFTGCYSTTVPWSSYTMYTYIPTSTAKDYWRVRFVDNSTTIGYIQIGYVWLSTFIEMPGMKPDQTIDDITTAKVTYSDGGQAYGDDGYNYRNPKINFPYLSSDHRNNVRNMWATVKNIKPIFAIIWPNSTTEEKPIHGVIDQEGFKFARTDDRNMRWTTSIQIKETF